MAYTTVINNKTSSIGSPTMYYTLQLEAVNRTSTSVDINYILNVQMKNSASLSGYNVNFNAIIKVGSTAYEFNFKSKNDYWEGILSKNFTGTFTVSASAGVTSLTTSLRTYSYGYSSAAGGTLNETSGTSITIPNVASTCSLSRTSITGGNTFTATVSNPQAGAEFQIQVVKGSTILATATGTHTFDGTLTWANQLTTAMTNELEVVFNTYLDGQLIDTQRKPLTYIVPSYTITAPTVNYTWYNRLGSKNVQGYTSFDYTLTGGSSKYNATIEYYVSFDGIQYVGNGATGLACKTVGTIPFTVQVVDSRGQTREISQNIVVYSYATPSIKSVAPVIANNVCTLQVGYEFSSVDGVNSATITGTIDAKSDTSSTNVTSASGTANVVMTKTYYGDNTLEGVCSIADGLGNTTIYNFVIPTENVPLDLNASGLGLAIGKVSEGTDGLVEINWDVQMGNEDTNLTFKLNGQDVVTGVPEVPVEDVKVNGTSVVTNKVANIDGSQFAIHFSTDTETIVGYWIDGKPIYRKVAYRGNIGSGSTSMTFALDNPETIINVAGLGDEGSGMSNAHYQLPYYNPTSTTYSLGMFYRSGAINFRGGSAVAIKNAYVWVDYTKTTS